MECAEPELERSARRARRVLWAFRLLFYPSALILAGALLGARAEEDPGRRLTGRTSQGQAIEIVVADGRPTYVRARFLMTCDNHPRKWPVDWWEYEDAPFRHHDGGFTIDVSFKPSFDDDRTSTRRVYMRASVDGDEVRGTMLATEWVTVPVGGDYGCGSGDVTFSARARA